LCTCIGCTDWGAREALIIIFIFLQLAGAGERCLTAFFS